MELDEKRIQEIVDRVVSRLGIPGSAQSPAPAPVASVAPAVVRERGAAPGVKGFARGTVGTFPSVDAAVRAARQAFDELSRQPLSLRFKIVAAMRDVTMRHVRELSEYAVAETGLGRVDDKIRKNTLATQKTPGPEMLVPQAFTGDHGLTIIEWAPYGVIGSISPCTNPTETIINNALSLISGGNAVVFNVHPSAKGVSAWHIHLLNEAIVGAGGPRNLIATVGEPTVATAEELMKHPGIRVVVVTGGPAVVKAAMASGKKVVAAGPGNPPVVVDETADLARAAKGIVAGASFDNNIICCDEKEVFAVAKIFEPLRKELKAVGAYELSESQIGRLTRHLFPDGKHSNKDFVGKNVSVILDTIGIRVGDDVRLAFAVVEENHPLVQVEQLLPVLPLVKCSDVDAAIEAAKRAEGGRGHTASVYSRNIEVMDRMAREMNTCIFVKNAPHYAGLGGDGEGYTSWTIAHPTGEGVTCVVHFVRSRRCTLQDYFRIV
ncbi:MAG: aldehyde dehydrogenase EutE [Deltaproteobacteria bacterium]|nr:aldehyde dehydrogenase EutE [Deltaproteobacteria bacterium]